MTYAKEKLKNCMINQDDEKARIVTERLLYELTHLNSKHKNDTNTGSYMEKVKMIDSLNHCIKIEHKRYKELKTLLEQKEDELRRKDLELYSKSDVITISNAIIKNQNDKILDLEGEVKVKDKIIDKQDKFIEELALRNNLTVKTINDLTSL